MFQDSFDVSYFLSVRRLLDFVIKHSSSLPVDFGFINSLGITTDSIISSFSDNSEVFGSDYDLF